ncbi:hypothetical protein SAMN05192574_102426 [Mucilaginibacter gossypiicola]|uniref:ABC-2 family transporter protein n=1 Tax=Mucilaginibacter gossypiicola TaxID=551995 RepID=A0A1H8DPK2_9SPHI|nr:hypothetical protein [Mucilaginibacter gossypiicola]SEN09170.1 hypothetical protein SAMN05192574_102426 [Mucilaginibacter gossypiicola]
MLKYFNPARFSRLFIKHTQEHYTRYLMSTVVLIGVMVLGGSFLIYMINTSLDPVFQMLLYAWLLLLGGTIFTSNIFAEYGSSKQVIATLSLPASHFEKYLVAWLYSFLILFTVVTVSFYGVMAFLINIKHFPQQRPELINLLQKPGALEFPILFIVLVLYALLHSIVFYGAIHFKKLHFIKTAFSFFIGIAVMMFGNKLLYDLLLHKDAIAGLPFTNVAYMEKGRVIVINLTDNKEFYALIMYMVLALMFWIAAYFRLKEKQA